MAKAAVAEPKLTGWQAIEAAVRRINGGSVEESDFDIVASAGLTGERLKDEMRRLEMIDHDMAIVGSLENVQQTEDDHETSTAARTAERKKLEAELAEVQARINARLNTLAVEQRQSDQKIESMRNALARLRAKAPHHVVQRVNEMRRQCKASDQACRLRDTESRVAWLRSITSTTPDDNMERMILAATPDSPLFIPGLKGAPDARTIFTREWPKKQAQWRDELARLEPTLAESQAAYAAELEAIEAGLDYYISK